MHCMTIVPRPKCFCSFPLIVFQGSLKPFITMHKDWLSMQITFFLVLNYPVELPYTASTSQGEDFYSYPFLQLRIVIIILQVHVVLQIRLYTHCRLASVRHKSNFIELPIDYNQCQLSGVKPTSSYWPIGFALQLICTIQQGKYFFL